MKKKFWIDLWWLLVFVFAGLVIVLVPIIVFMKFLSPTLSLHLVQWSQTIVMFLVPAWLWVILYKKESLVETMRLHWPGWKMMGLTALLMVVSVPALDALATFCQNLPLPQALADYAEAESVQQTEAVKGLLSVNGFGGWLELVMLMCVGTALAEESLFRGALVRCFMPVSEHFSANHRTKRVWVAIIVGLVFSICHFEVYGFLPRWLLGILLVYLMFWTGSIWPSILAHAMNNLWALIQMKNALAEGIDLDEAVSTADLVGTWGVVLSVVLAVLVLCLIYRDRRVTQ